MASKTLNTRIQIRNDLAATWTEKNPVLLKGEMGVETDTRKIKIGDGLNKWSDLGYSGADVADIEKVIADNRDTTYSLEPTGEQTDAQALSTIESPKDGDTAIIKRAISGDKASYTAYVYDGTWKAMDGNYNADNVYFSNDMLVTKEIGYITLSNGQGTIPSKGKNLSEVFEAMFVQELNPTTTQPKVNLAFSQAKAYEVGTVVSPSYTATFDDGNYTYGPDPTGATVTSWEISDTDGNTAATASGSFAAVTVADSTNYKITAKANHTAGEIPVTNKQNPYEAGRIAAGSKSATSSAITGYRSFFYGVLDTSSADAPLTSEIVRGLTNGGAYTGTKTFTLNGSATAKRIIIAIPASSTRSGLKEVILTSAMNTPVTDSYVKTANDVQVEGVNGAIAVEYNVWCY